MSSLRELQAALHAHLLVGDDAIAVQLAERNGVGAGARLRIYHHAYRARLLEALRDSFETTWAWLGDARFDAVAGAYIEAHPPTERSVRGYGAGLPEWLRAQSPDDGEVAELAELDWCLRAAFDGPDAPPLKLQALQGLSDADWERVGFRLAPTLQRLTLHFNTLPIWHAIDRDQSPPPAEPLHEPLPALVWRKGLQPHFRSSDALERAALDLLMAGHSFAEVCALLDRRGAGADHGALLLRRWFDDELIVGLSGLG